MNYNKLEHTGVKKGPFSDLEFTEGPMSGIYAAKLALELALEYDRVALTPLHGEFKEPDVFEVTSQSGTI